MRSFLRVAFLAAFLSTFGHSSIGAACAACGCGDPSVSEIGIPDTDAGGAIGGLAVDARRDVIGGDRVSEVRVSAVGIWTATSDLQLYGRLPWGQRQLNRDSVNGAGDADLGAILVLWRTRGLSRGQSVQLQTQVTAPTGAHRGSNLDLMTGGGSTLTQAGLGWFAHRREWRFYASAAYRKTLIPASDYTAADVRLANAGIQRPLASERIDGTLELNARDSGPDHWPLGTTIHDTGGTVAYLTPGALASFGPANRRWFVRGSVQIPVLASTYGSQRLGPVVQAGVFKSF